MGGKLGGLEVFTMHFWTQISWRIILFFNQRQNISPAPFLSLTPSTLLMSSLSVILPYPQISFSLHRKWDIGGRIVYLSAQPSYVSQGLLAVSSACFSFSGQWLPHKVQKWVNEPSNLNNWIRCLRFFTKSLVWNIHSILCSFFM